jgi:diaminopimelate decarboxylase
MACVVSTGSDGVEVAGTSDGKRALQEELACRFGTPAYLYDAEALATRAGELKDVLPVERLLFSFKANPLPSVAAELRRNGCQADLTSPGELAAAREAGFDLSLSLYGGPGKGEDEYLHAIRGGVVSFSVESAIDLRRLSAAAETSDTTVRALLRINPHTPPRAKLAMAGVASQFGFEEEELRGEGEAIRRLAGLRVQLVGFHLYWGTQIADAGSLLDSFETTLSIADELAETIGFPLEVLNLGGGFPWPYAHAGTGPDLTPLREGIRALRARGGAVARAEWWFESGRYLTASSGTLLTRVMEVKRSKDDRLFLILDTGIHHLGGMAGLGRIPRFSVDLEVPASRRGNASVSVDVVGPLCTPLDCLAKKIELPEVEPGDLLAIPNVGAYGATASVGDFLSRPAAVEILHRGGDVLAVHQLRGGHESLL